MLSFVAPHVDYHALAPELIIAGTLVVVLLVDLASERNRALLGTISGIGLLAAMVPILTLAVDGTDRLVLSGNGGYVVDNFALTLKALFLVGGYVVVLMSTNYVAEGDYYEGEYYFLLLSSILGMVVMASSRDLITIFIALETLSIPAYMLAAWRKRDAKSNEAGLKYYLMGALFFAMALLPPTANTTISSRQLLITPDHLRGRLSGVIGLIDYGMVGRLEEDKREQLIDPPAAGDQRAAGHGRSAATGGEDQDRAWCRRGIVRVGRWIRPVGRRLVVGRRIRRGRGRGLGRRRHLLGRR